MEKIASENIKRINEYKTSQQNNNPAYLEYLEHRQIVKEKERIRNLNNTKEKDLEI